MLSTATFVLGMYLSNRSRLVCITQGIDPDILRRSLTILHAEPGTYRPASLQDLMAMSA
jgi:hypothetical protein